MSDPSPKRHTRLLPTLFLVIAAFPICAAQAQDDVAGMIARIEAPQTQDPKELAALSIAELLVRLQVPALSIAVVKDFKLHWAKAYGVADAATGRPVDTQTRFQAASISKPVTALAAMRLVQERRLTLDADINTWLKSWKVPVSDLTRMQAVTPRALLSHTSGAKDPLHNFHRPRRDLCGMLAKARTATQTDVWARFATPASARKDPPHAGLRDNGPPRALRRLASGSEPDLCGAPTRRPVLSQTRPMGVMQRVPNDGFGFPGYAPNTPLPTPVQIIKGQAPSNVGKVVFTRAPFEAYKYSGGGYTIMQLALSELSGRPFAQVMQSTVLTPLGMAHSTFEPLPTATVATNAALAHDEHGQRMGPPWHVYPEQAAASLWSTPSDLAKLIIEIQTGLRGPTGKVINQRTARDMISPPGIGRYAMGLAIDRHQDGWYFSHNGSNWGYRAWMSGHIRKGYGVVIMSNGDNGLALMNQIAGRVEAAYRWDSLEEPMPN